MIIITRRKIAFIFFALGMILLVNELLDEGGYIGTPRNQTNKYPYNHIKDFITDNVLGSSSNNSTALRNAEETINDDANVYLTKAMMHHHEESSRWMIAMEHKV